jgi:non-ribosomal peptide synthetase component F
MSSDVADTERKDRTGASFEPGQTLLLGDEPRLDQLFEAGCDWLTARGQSDRVAVHTREGVLTYHDLDCLASQLARYLLACGSRSGDRIGLLLDEGPETYVAMLAVLKLQATYVPLDPAFPADRIRHITAAARVAVLLTETSLADRMPARCFPDGQVVLIDAAAGDISRNDSTRLSNAEHGGPAGELASLIYPSAPTERPRCVEITHTGMCTFALTAAKIYGIRAEDRLYESLSSGSDLSFEGIWVAWMVGATLVPKPAGPRLSGRALRRFLAANNVTALYCEPGLLASLDEELPQLRVIAVSGQPCPSDLLARWRRPGRRLVSIYGTTGPQPAVATLPVLATADGVRLSDGGATTQMASRAYQRSSDDQVQRLLID